MVSRTASVILSGVLTLFVAPAVQAQIGPGYSINPWLFNPPVVAAASNLTLQLVPPATISSISTIFEEAGDDLDIMGTGFMQFLPRSNFFGTFTPMVKFGVATGSAASAPYSVLSDTHIRVSSIPASAVNGPVMLVYRRDVTWSSTASWITVAQSPVAFKLGTGIRIENSDPQLSLDYVRVVHGITATVIIDPAQPASALPLLTPFGQSGSISPRVIVPANIPSMINYSFSNSVSILTMPGTVTFPGGSRWRLTVPGGQLIQVF